MRTLALPKVITMVFVNGCFDENSSQLPNLAEDIIVTNLHSAPLQHQASIAKQFTLDGSVGDGLFVYIADNSQLNYVIHAIHIYDHHAQDEIKLQHFISIGKNAKLELIEEFQNQNDSKQYQVNARQQLYVAEDASLNYYTLANNNQNTGHETIVKQVEQERNSQVKMITFVADSTNYQEQLSLLLKAPYAGCFTGGFYQLSGNGQRSSFLADIKHQASFTNSNMLYKGVLDNKSRAAFQGKIYAEQNVEKISAYQANHNLLLSPLSEVKSQPELEIYAEDVKCKHGATVGQLDEEKIFYLMSRGIPQTMAKTMLLKAFAMELFDVIDNKTIQSYIKAAW
jgi:Fe-S cluster assembly protein SufD